MIGVVLLNFGEPDTGSLEEVVPYLERIFVANASLEPGRPIEEVRRRARELAEARAPGLVEEYRKIGGSPLRAQAEGQADALSAELGARGREARVLLGMQFTQPTIAAAVERARAEGVEKLVGLPVYPLCGHSTSVAALAELEREIEASGWSVPLAGIGGWHPHPAYLELRADAIRRYVEGAGLDLADAGTRLVFSVHGTPVRYLEAGSRYDKYAEACCRSVAGKLGVDDFLLGYQNHANRGIPWTQPEIDDVIRGAVSEGASRVVVDPISFMHEQSETLAELDVDLREIAEGAGLDFHRVPIPHADARLSGVLADLVEATIEEAGSGPLELFPCRCKPDGDVYCLNSDRL